MQIELLGVRYVVAQSYSRFPCLYIEKRGTLMNQTQAEERP